MASIFLSYAREDRACAERLARVLKQAGHHIWWDQHIASGHEFANEIEAALENADLVVVAWSKYAGKSPWVRDEAAVGRDKGRLLPLLIDGGQPPIGFRQFQALDLSGWKARKKDSRTTALIDAVHAKLSGKTAHFGPNKPRFGAKRLPTVWAAALALLLTVAAATAAWLWRSAGSPDEPRFAISPADGSALSRQVAHDLVLAVPGLSRGKASAYELIHTTDAPSANADLVLTLGASSSGNRERRNLSLRASDDAILWSASFDQPSAASANLPQQLAVQAQRALSCAAEALSYRREGIGRDTLKLYLSGCTTFDYALDTNIDYSEQIKLFEQILAKAPHFEPAWAKLFTLEIDELMSLSVENPRLLAEKMRSQIAQAQKLGLDFGEFYAAKAITRPPGDFIGMFRDFDEGIERHPDSDILYRLRGYRSVYVGRMRDSVDLAAHAVQLNPLSPANQQMLATAYVYAGDTEAGFAQLRKAEQLWPAAPTILSARRRLELRYGDPNKALASMQDPNGPGEGSYHSQLDAFLRARIDPTPANIERAIIEARKVYEQEGSIVQVVQTLAQFGRKDEVLDILLHYRGGVMIWFDAEVLFRPALRGVWRDPRSMAAAAHLGLLRYWKVSGVWPDFCSDPTLPYDCEKEAAKYRV